MEIFRVAFNPARYQALRYTEMPADDEFDLFFFGGDQASRWRVREVRPSEPSFERPDIWHLEGSAGTMVFPASVAQALEPWRDPLRSVRSLRESYCPVSGEEDNRSDGTCETPAYAGADHQEVA
jgi:hypothetical protein